MINTTGKSFFGYRRYRTRLKPFSGLPEVTALVDVLFLAMMLIVSASSFVKVSGVNVSLPEVTSRNIDSMVNLERLVVSLTPPDRNGEVRIYFRDKQMTGKMLKQELGDVHSKFPQTAIIISADRKVPFEKLAEVMTTVASAELRSFVAVMPKEDNAPSKYEK